MGDNVVERVLVVALPAAFLGSFAVGWFSTPLSVGVGDWDQMFSDAWVSVQAFLERGRPPLWSIQISGGAPLAANPQSLSFSPLLLVPAALGPIVGLKVLSALLIGAGFIGCYHLGRRWIGDSLGAAAFAFVFVFSGYFAIHFRAGHFPWAFFYVVPWILLFADRLLFESVPTYWSSVGLLVSLVVLFSGPVYQALVFLFLPVGAIYGFVSRRDIGLIRAGYLLLLILCALLITMPRWIAIVDWQVRTPRYVPGHGGMPLLEMGQMLFMPIEDYNFRVLWGGSGLWEYWSYAGMVAGLVALASIRVRARWRQLARGFIIAGLILAWRGPWGSLLEWISPYLPIAPSVRVYSRFLVLVVLGIALLAGGGLATLRQHATTRGLFWAPTLLVIAMAADYYIVVHPIWSRVFSLRPDEAYSDWGLSLRDPPYSVVRSAPFTLESANAGGEFNSRMLPLLMGGAVVANAYATLNGVPWMERRDGKVVESLPEDAYKLTNHNLEFWGDFTPGQEIAINLHFVKAYWKVDDPKVARIYDDDGPIRLQILEPCHHVRITMRSGWESAGWAAAGIGFLLAAVAPWRFTSRS